MEMNQYLTMFIDESREHLQTMNENLLELENNPDDIDIVHNIFRSAHTLKGMSATMGFEDLASLTHEMENVLDLVRNGKLKMDTDITDVLFQCFDSLEAMVEDIANGGSGQLDVSETVQTLKAIMSGDFKGSSREAQTSPVQPSQANRTSSLTLDQYQLTVLKQSLESGHRVYWIQVVIDANCVLKAARAYMVFNALEQVGEIVHSSPSVEEIEQEKFDDRFSVFVVTQQEPDAIRERIMSVSEIAQTEVAEMDEARLQEWNNEAETVKEAVKSEQPDQAKGTGEPVKKEKKPDRAAAGGQVSRTIRVDLDRLDQLMNLLSELLIDRVRLESLAEEIKNYDLIETVEHLVRVSTDLQNIVLKLRMVPVEAVFNRFPRMVRDIARSLNKKVNLVITGAETELDRTVIDEIGDPLVHLLRNSLDHGLESPEERKRAGKEETGNIYLRAFHSGNHVFIEIEDDGRGIDRDKVLQSAVKKNLIDESEGEQMSDVEVFNLLFSSGFSTAEKISDLSGRGVGLDVVKSKITALGGQVSVHSQKGIGTRFTVQLPLTLSIISAMLIRLGEEKYAIPLSSIVETAIMMRDEIRLVHGMQMISYRDHIIPIVSLKEVLECPDTGEAEQDEMNVVIIRKGEKLAALIVDELIGQQEIVLKSLGPYLSRTFAISGATILGDGQVALIIDTNSLVK